MDQLILLSHASRRAAVLLIVEHRQPSTRRDRLLFEAMQPKAPVVKRGIRIENGKETLSELLSLPDGTGAGTGSDLPRAVVVSGITENQLHGLMTVCRKTGMQQSLWAALTPTSETWPLAQLLSELQAERKALSERKKK